MYAVLALGLVVLLAWYASRPQSYDPREHFTNNTATGAVPKLRADTSPWTAKLGAAVDDGSAASYAPGAARQQVPHDATEIREPADKIGARSNATTTARATLLDVPQVHKTVDSYKTIEYELVMVVYSSETNAAMKLFARASVPKDNSINVSELRMYSAAPGDDGPRGSLGPDHEEHYASFAPALSYP